MSTIVSDLVSHLQCGEAISDNDAVYIDSSDGKIYKFDPTDDTQTFAGLAKESGVLNDFIRVSQSGRIKGFSGLIPGAFVYASVTVPGSFQLVEPAPSQKVILGIAKSATELIINGGLGIKPGGDGGGGGLDAYYIENMEGLANVSDFATGNNATFLGGGTLQGTLAIEDVAPISGLKSLKYTQAAGSLNDYFASEIIDIDLKQQNNDSGMTLYFEYDGNDNDMCFVVWDVTNNQRLSSEAAFVKLTGKAQRYSLSFYVPTSCTQIRWGAQVLVVNSGKVLVVDDVEISTDPYALAGVAAADSSVRLSGANGFGSTATTTRRFSTVVENLGGDVLYTDSPTLGAQFRVLTPGVYTASYSEASTANSADTTIFLNINGVAVAFANVALNTASIATKTPSAAWSGNLNVGDIVTAAVGTAANNNGSAVLFTMSRVGKVDTHVLTPTDTFSTDTAPLTYAGSSQYTLSTLANAPVGTFITFTYAANTNTRTQTNAAPPTQTTADMNVNGIQIFTRAYNAASTAASPAAIAVQIGKGLKGTSLGLYKSAGKVTAGSLDNTPQGTFAIDEGAKIKSYSESTGILIIDAGFRPTVVTNATFAFEDVSNQTNGYLTINASKSSSLTAVPTPLVAYLKDVKTSGTAGGTFTAGAWQTRTLNTVEGDTSFVTLSANQFTLPSGRYEIEAEAVGYFVSGHKIKIYNVSDASDVIIGSNIYCNDVDGSAESTLKGIVTLNSSKVLELQHRCQTTKATDGFGTPFTFGVSEVYSQIKIKKVG